MLTPYRDHSQRDQKGHYSPNQTALQNKRHRKKGAFPYHIRPRILIANSLRMPFLAFVDSDGITIRITNKRHVTYRGLNRAKVKFDVRLF